MAKGGEVNKTRIEWCDYDRGWIEAMIDAEGWLSLIKEKRPHFKAGCTYKPTLGISNNNLNILDKAKFLLGAPRAYSRNGNGVSMVAINSGRLRIVLPLLKLIAKEKQRILLLEALDILSIHRGRGDARNDKEIGRLEGIYREMRNLNAGTGGKRKCNEHA